MGVENRVISAATILSLFFAFRGSDAFAQRPRYNLALTALSACIRNEGDIGGKILFVRGGIFSNGSEASPPSNTEVIGSQVTSLETKPLEPGEIQHLLIEQPMSGDLFSRVTGRVNVGGPPDADPLDDILSVGVKPCLPGEGTIFQIHLPYVVVGR